MKNNPKYGSDEWKELTRSYVRWNDEEICGFFGDYFYLSNFYKVNVWYEGLLYPSTEHAYQAAKTILPVDRKPFSVNGDMSAADSKRAGRKLEIRNNWDDIKFWVMHEIVYQKFLRNHDIQVQLLNTGDRYLEETNHWEDTYWGVDYQSNTGHNALGKILMNVRKMLREANSLYPKK